MQTILFSRSLMEAPLDVFMELGNFGDWVVVNEQSMKIQGLNLSFGTAPCPKEKTMVTKRRVLFIFAIVNDSILRASLAF